MKRKVMQWLENKITDDITKAELDIIEFCKKCVRAYKTEDKVENKVDWLPMFETLWKMYPRKVNKELAKRTFEHKIRGLGEQECKDKCNLIYKAQKIAIARWEEQGTEMQYIPHYSSWLNSSVPNSPKYKGI